MQVEKLSHERMLVRNSQREKQLLMRYEQL